MMKWKLALFLFCSFSSLIAEERDSDLSIKRDILVPVGLPIVSSYHDMRESLFFNMKSKNPALLESVGDFLLAPTRYLFAGKDISLSEDLSVDVQQSFRYGSLSGLKTLAALLAAPISLPAGSALKGLAYLSPKVREKYARLRQALSTPHLESQLAGYRAKEIYPFYSEEAVPCQGHVRPSDISDKHKKEVDALKTVVELLEAHDILYWIDCGTCLGAYRYGGFIPWDVDIDISILEADHDNVKQILQQLDPKKYQIQDWSSYAHPKTFLKLYLKETRTQLDIYHYRIDEEAKTLRYMYTYEDSFMPESWKKSELVMTSPLPFDVIFPLRRADFDGLKVLAPNKIEPFLKSKYGENLDPTMVWDADSQTYIKVKDHPYWSMVE